MLWQQPDVSRIHARHSLREISDEDIFRPLHGVREIGDSFPAVPSAEIENVTLKGGRSMSLLLKKSGNNPADRLCFPGSSVAITSCPSKPSQFPS
jgi:hypothetical protein